MNLLWVLRALLQTGSVTHAAELIGRTPPAVSASLSQLREILKDPLFIRVGNRLQPTTRAAQLIEPVEAAIQQIGLIFEAQQFDPELSERVFVVVATDSLVVHAGSRIVQELRRRAPNTSVQFIGLDDTVSEAMATREVDFALLPEIAVDSLSPVPLSYQALGALNFDAVLMQADHTLSGHSTLQIDDLAGFPQIGFRPNSALFKYVKAHPMMKIETAVTVSQNLTIPSLLENSDLIAIVMASMAEREATGRNLVAVPLEPALELPYGLVWSAVLERDAAHVWFRALTKEVLGA